MVTVDWRVTGVFGLIIPQTEQPLLQYVLHQILEGIVFISWLLLIGKLHVQKLDVMVVP